MKVQRAVLLKIFAVFFLLTYILFNTGCISDIFLRAPSEYELSKKYYWHEKDFHTVAEFMASVDYDLGGASIEFTPFGIRKNTTNVKDSDIDEKVVRAMRRLWWIGCREVVVSDWEHVVYFNFWSTLVIGYLCGIMYGTDGYVPDMQYLMIRTPIDLEDNWYYYLTSYESWRGNREFYDYYNPSGLSHDELMNSLFPNPE